MRYDFSACTAQPDDPIPVSVTTITTMVMTVENMVAYLRRGGAELPEQGRVRFELYDDDNAGHQMVSVSWTEGQP